MKSAMSYLLVGLSLMAGGGAALADQQLVGINSSGVTVTQETAVGWSVKKSLLGKTVYNQSDEKVGVINDLIIGPDSTITHIVVAAGGFVGKSRHDVAIEAAGLEVRNGKFYIEGATRDNVRTTPTFEYVKGY